MVDKNDKRIFGYSLINVLNHSIPLGTILFISKAGLIMSLDLYVCPNVIKSKLKFSWLDLDVKLQKFEIDESKKSASKGKSM